MSNTVKIKNKKKKKELKINYKLWAIVFGVFVALIVAGAVWASFHWGVGMGTIGVRPVTPDENADAFSTEMASESATEMITLTPEQLKEMGVVVDGVEGANAENADADADAAAKKDGAGQEDAGEKTGDEGGAGDKAEDASAGTTGN